MNSFLGQITVLVAGVFLSPILFAQAISPEAAKQFEQKHLPHVFIDVENAEIRKSNLLSQNKDLRTIYFSSGFPNHLSRVLAGKDREAGAKESYWLEGTPLDWRDLSLALPTSTPFDKRPQAISVQSLSDAIKDNVDLQVIDLRMEDEYRSSHIAGARHIMPHQIKEQLPTISKQRWLVFVDAGGALGEISAIEMIEKGYLLSAFLRGGYPAWVATNQK